MTFKRASGILLHPTSLPGEFGIGDLGPKAFEFVDFLGRSKQAYWQVLPLGPTGYGDSPYSSFSAFAGNTLLISPEKLVEDGLVDAGSVNGHPEFTSDRADFGGVYEWKNQLLSVSYENFTKTGDARIKKELEAFCQEASWWLDDYASYRAIKFSQDQKPWYEWPDPLKLRETGAIAAINDQLSDAIEAQKFYQFLFFRQWSALRDHANDRGVKIIGDIPIFLALDSADVWCNQSKFKLNKDGSPTVVSGVPPDFFSSTGQLWGNPIYDWEAMQQDGFGWWIARFRWTLRAVDIVRIDHFRGFAAAWEVPGGDTTAENGEWVTVPGKELFRALDKGIENLPVIAEDLGVITPDVIDIRDSFNIPGMRILQYGFTGDPHNHDLPHNYPRNCVAYTGTHDNDTAVGWWQGRTKTGEAPSAGTEADFCLKYLDSDGLEIHWDFIRAVWASVADTAIAPLQDVLGLGNESRMNLPASTSGNWYWRFADGSLTPEITEKLRTLTEIYGRTAD